jgi:hypothetical protein
MNTVLSRSRQKCHASSRAMLVCIKRGGSVYRVAGIPVPKARPLSWPTQVCLEADSGASRIEVEVEARRAGLGGSQ